MDNIFKNVYFGKAYKTRDGRKALFLYTTNFKGTTWYDCHVENETVSFPYMADGLMVGNRKDFQQWEEDIISEWEEPIDEENLNRLTVAEYPLNNGIEEAHWNTHQCKLREAYKAGYRKAKEE